jgi:Flp pilus assembly protein TadD
VLLFALLSASVLRPTVNFSLFAGADTFELGSRAFDAGDYATAAKRFRQSTAYRRAFPEAWANLAMSLDRVGDHEAADAAWAKLKKMAPDDPRWAEVVEQRSGDGEP